MFDEDQKIVNQALFEAAEGLNLSGMQHALDLGAQVNSVHDNKNTALHVVAPAGNGKALEMLLRAGADLSLENGDGKTARELARAAGQERAFANAVKAVGRRSSVRSIVNNTEEDAAALSVLYEPAARRAPVRATANVFPRETLLKVPRQTDRFRRAAYDGDRDTIDWLVAGNKSNRDYVNGRDENGLSALDYAVLGNQPVAVANLIGHGADTDAASHPGKVTALMLAAAANRVSSAQKLLPAADVNAQDAEGNNALIYAVDYRADATLKELLAKPGVQVDLPNAQGRTALHQACIMGSPEEMQMLMESGANPVLPDNDRKTPAMLAWEYGHRAVFSQALNASRGKRLHTVGASEISR